MKSFSLPVISLWFFFEKFETLSFCGCFEFIIKNNIRISFLNLPKSFSSGLRLISKVSQSYFNSGLQIINTLNFTKLLNSGLQIINSGLQSLPRFHLVFKHLYRLNKGFHLLARHIEAISCHCWLPTIVNKWSNSIHGNSFVNVFFDDDLGSWYDILALIIIYKKVICLIYWFKLLNRKPNVFVSKILMISCINLYSYENKITILFVNGYLKRLFPQC